MVPGSCAISGAGPLSIGERLCRHVRRACEERLEAAGLCATILRPWYILGPGHWWPLALQSVYRLMGQFPATHDAAVRLGLVTLREMLAWLVWAVEHLPASRLAIEVPEIRRLGGLS